MRQDGFWRYILILLILWLLLVIYRVCLLTPEPVQEPLVESSATMILERMREIGDKDARNWVFGDEFHGREIKGVGYLNDVGRDSGTLISVDYMYSNDMVLAEAGVPQDASVGERVRFEGVVTSWFMDDQNACLVVSSATIEACSEEEE